MEQCKICDNNKICKENNWVITMDKGYKLISPICEFMCDNFSTNKSIIMDTGKGVKK